MPACLLLHYSLSPVSTSQVSLQTTLRFLNILNAFQSYMLQKMSRQRNLCVFYAISKLACWGIVLWQLNSYSSTVPYKLQILCTSVKPQYPVSKPWNVLIESPCYQDHPGGLSSGSNLYGGQHDVQDVSPTGHPVLEQARVFYVFPRTVFRNRIRIVNFDHLAISSSSSAQTRGSGSAFHNTGIC